MKELGIYITESAIKSGLNKKEFMIIKPGFLKSKNAILEMLREYDIIPVSELQKRLSLSEARKLYKPHSKEDFYDDLCEYMASGDSIGFIMCNYGKYDMTKVKDTIRKKFGKNEMENAIHSSDSPLNVVRESKIYFGTPTI